MKPALRSLAALVLAFTLNGAAKAETMWMAALAPF